MAKHSSHILDLAKRGAEVRLRDLADEAKLLIELFPHLRDTIDQDELPIRFILRKGRDRAEAKATRGRRKMSAAARKAVSARMKKFWAARRAARKK